MSISTRVLIECRLPDNAPGGWFVTFDADMMFEDLRLDEQGHVWKRWAALRTEEPNPWEREPLSGELCVRSDSEDDANEQNYAILIKEGRVEAVRPGWREAWSPTAQAPDGPARSVLVFATLYGDETTPYDQAIWMDAAGLPEPLPGMTWVVATSGTLTLLPNPKSDREGWEKACHAKAEPFHGWVFLSDPNGKLPRQAMRFVSGHQQWVVPVDESGTATAPKTLDERGSRRPGADPRHAALLASCAILPQDYAGYGGENVRWERDNDHDSDCSGGCKWFVPLHNPAYGGGADGDWGVCANKHSHRAGRLTWEHQAGRDCFEGGESLDSDAEE